MLRSHGPCRSIPNARLTLLQAFDFSTRDHSYFQTNRRRPVARRYRAHTRTIAHSYLVGFPKRSQFSFLKTNRRHPIASDTGQPQARLTTHIHNSDNQNCTFQYRTGRGLLYTWTSKGKCHRSSASLLEDFFYWKRCSAKSPFASVHRRLDIFYNLTFLQSSSKI